MTYSRTHRPADRIATLVAVGALQAAAFYALIAGFTVAFTPVDNPLPIRATNSPLPPPPAPETPVRARPHEHEIITTITPFKPVIPEVVPTPTTIADPVTVTDRPGSGTIQEPRPTVSPALTQRPRPLGRPGEWVTEADYPTSALRLDHAGTVGFVLTVSAAGRVTGCEITRSSGFAELDTATCALLQRRARFEPARDAAGQPATGTYANAVRWQLPD
ncbi:energy transducer TonB [Novosphingobium sp.]|uniref:energy transducer TonB n=1 Tax=Novosphingobium sp. TaxID=1874826 RepID=UPI0026395E54|nr:energy transducer TonB [Novosphingobium sp.]